jgi:hypothetical protein
MCRMSYKKVLARSWRITAAMRIAVEQNFVTKRDYRSDRRAAAGGRPIATRGTSLANGEDISSERT